jgi:hypothetical protein
MEALDTAAGGTGSSSAPPAAGRRHRQRELRTLFLLGTLISVIRWAKAYYFAMGCLFLVVHTGPAQSEGS